MTRTQIVKLLIEEVPLAALTDPTDYENAADAAARETEWAYPVSTDFKTHWTLERAKRHLFFYLATQTAHKFKVKQISLNMKFDHYFKLIGYMDKAFKEVVEERPDEFANVDPYTLFGSKIDAGFAYDPLGRDITYDSAQEVIVKPNGNS